MWCILTHNISEEGTTLAAEMGSIDIQSLRLLFSVAEQLKMPLTSIARQAELSALDGAHADPEAVAAQAQAALTLVDSYLLGLELLAEQQTLQLEPVSVSSTLVDTAHILERYAKQYGVQLEVRLAGRYEPVMAHTTGLKAALLSLGYALVGAQATTDQPSSRRIVLAGHRNAHGIVAGLYGNASLDNEALRTAIKLCGKAQQPMVSLANSSGAGVFVADALAQAMESQLRVGKHARHTGLAMTLQPSKQLQLI